MKSLQIATQIPIADRRSLELLSLVYSRTGLAVSVVVDPNGEHLCVQFDDVAAVLVRGWDSAWSSLCKLSGDGAIFEIEEDIELYSNFGVNIASKRYKHFIVSCYDDVIEVLAARISISKQIGPAGSG